MKIFFSISLICWIGLVQAQILLDQTFNADNVRHLSIANFSGTVSVTPSAGDQISVHAAWVGKDSRDDVSIDHVRKADYLLIYLRTPCTEAEADIYFNPEDPRQMQQWKNDCHWLDGEDDHMPVIHITVQAPKYMRLYASTILEGNLEIVEMDHIWASNVNGHISLESVEQVHSAQTVNGDITITYRSPPTEDASFKTINGDIKLEVDPALKATTSFKSYTGDFYTNLEQVEVMPGTKVAETKTNGFKYRLEDQRTLAINGGGAQMNFETFNGNVYLTAIK